MYFCSKPPSDLQPEQAQARQALPCLIPPLIHQPERSPCLIVRQPLWKFRWRCSTPPRCQQLLVLLAEKPDRPAADNQLLAALIRLEQANDRAAQARLAAAKLIQSSKRQSVKAERKAHAHRLIQ